MEHPITVANINGLELIFLDLRKAEKMFRRVLSKKIIIMRRY
jgi:hypothetical protein